MVITDTTKCTIMMQVMDFMMHKVACDTHREWSDGSMTETMKEIGSAHVYDYYSFIPNAINKVVEQLVYASTILKEEHPNRTSFRFLDVGCGIGNIMMLAKSSGFRVAHGIEFDKNHQKRFLYDDINQAGSEVRVFWQDAMKFTDYGAYDVVYMYRPIHDYLKERKLERIVTGTMKKGAFFLANLCERNWGKTNMKWANAHNGRHLIDGIWRKE